MGIDAKVLAARRARVCAGMERRGGGVMVLPAADEKPRNADNEYVFRQDSDNAWAVGLDEPMGGAVLLARGGERKRGWSRSSGPAGGRGRRRRSRSWIRGGSCTSCGW